MKRQQPKMSCGIDTINNKVVKTCYKELAKPMTLVINKSISECYVPQVYKLAKTVPLYKKGPANEWRNYRPVSLLSALSKILEKGDMSPINESLRSQQNTMSYSIQIPPKESNLSCSS